MKKHAEASRLPNTSGATPPRKNISSFSHFWGVNLDCYFQARIEGALFLPSSKGIVEVLGIVFSIQLINGSRPLANSVQQIASSRE